MADTDDPTQASNPRSGAQATSQDEVINVGASAWRSQVLRQARRLREELSEVPAAMRDATSEAVAVEAEDRIGQAEALAHAEHKNPFVTFRDWWTGNAVETAWDDLQTAREKLLLFEPSDQVRAQLPTLQRRLARASPDPAHDPRLSRLRAIAESSGELSADQRAQVAAAHQHVTATANDHTPARLFRNDLLLWTVGLAVLSLVVASIESHGFRYVLIGAVAGMLTTAVAWRSLTQLSGPYSVSTAQATLKISAGAASALLGVVLVRSGVISGLSVSGSAAYGYAIVFGFSQQAFTQAVDGAAKRLGGS